MDTDSLSPMAYEVVIKADEIMDGLRMEISTSCSDCESEDDFLKSASSFIDETLQNPRDYLEDWDYLDHVDIAQFEAELKDLKKYIQDVIRTPLEIRGTPPFA